jgi:hypothetical protein
MTKAPKKQDSEIEMPPNGWERFENAVDAAIASGPKHRVAGKSAEPVQTGSAFSSDQGVQNSGKRKKASR